MKILYTEASPGWGGQELRILREAEGMRSRGHEVLLAVQEGGGLVVPAQANEFSVIELPFRKRQAIKVLYQLLRLVYKANIDVINTHSSLDAWIGGLAGKISGCPVIRTRHLSTPVRKGINSLLLYNWLANHVVTTCEQTAQTLQSQAKLSCERCFSVPTGVDPTHIVYSEEEVLNFRETLGVGPQDCLAGTLCVLRGWKGISDLLKAAKRLEHIPNLKWVIVGSGVSEDHFRKECKALGLEQKVIFAGHIAPPYIALAAMDVFLLLSWANEGVSQASLQAAFLEKPLITTPTGGLKEICIDHVTGFQVPCHDPEAVANALLPFINNPILRQEMGEKAKELVLSKFLLSHTLDQMENIYECVGSSSSR